MDARLQRRVQRYGWDKAAASYDGAWRAPLATVTERLLAAADLQPGERVLDVACGTGAVTLAAARTVGPAGEVVGADLSENMVEGARRAARAAHLEQCRFVRADAEDLADLGREFDAALCGLGLMYLPAPERAIAGMTGRLARGGRLVASVWGRRERCGWAELFPIVDARVASEVCPLFFRLGTGDALADAFGAAGLTRVDVERFDVQLRFDGEESACEAAFLGGPVALAWARFDDRLRAAVRAEYLASIAHHRVGADFAIPGEFVVVRGEVDE